MTEPTDRSAAPHGGFFAVLVISVLIAGSILLMRIFPWLLSLGGSPGTVSCLFSLAASAVLFGSAYAIFINLVRLPARWSTWAYGALLLLVVIGLLKVPAHVPPIPVEKPVEQGPGNPAKRGGSPTVRWSYEPLHDDPLTSNDESNDQPRGFFGTLTLQVTNWSSGNSYPLDADVEGSALERLYFPKGGWVDFYDCALDGRFEGECEDENGNLWLVEGEY